MNQCTYRPMQGQSKGVQCLLPAGHAGSHIFDPAKMPLLSDEEPASYFTDEEIASAIKEDEIRRRSEELDAAQGIWERAAIRSRPKMPCTECTGNGQVFGGSLGDHCPTCNGTRVVDDESVEVDFEMPDFKALRDPLSAYGNALIDRRHGKRTALPPASSVPTLEAISSLTSAGRAAHKRLAAGQPQQAALPAPAPSVRRGGFETDDGIEGTADDGEIDAIEAEILGSRGPR